MAQERYYFDFKSGESEKGFLNKKEVLTAFVGGVPADLTLEDLGKLYLSDINSKVKIIIDWTISRMVFGEF